MEEEGSFTGSVGTYDRDAFSLFDREGDVTKGRSSVGVVKMEVFDLEGDHSPRASMAR